MAGVATFSGLLDADSRGDEGSARQPVGKWRGEWTTTARYVEGDTVTFEGSTYRCLIGDRRNKQPDEYPRVWRLVVGEGDSKPANRGKDGRDGRDGLPGLDGKSIKGDRGEKGASGVSVRGEKGERGEKGHSVKGDKGDSGKDGIDGQSVTYWDEWRSDVEYPALAIVAADGSSWITKAAHRSSEDSRPGSGADWGLVARAGQDAVRPGWNDPYRLVNGRRQFPDAFTVLVVSDHASAARAGQPVYVKSNGRADLAKADSAGTANVVALLMDGIDSAGQSGNVRTAGSLTLDESVWDLVTGDHGGLTPGAVYWLSFTTAGELTTVQPSDPNQMVRIGTAFSTTMMSINIQQVQAGGGTVPTNAILDETGAPILDET